MHSSVNKWLGAACIMGLVVVISWLQWCTLISSEVMCVGALGSLDFDSLSEPNKPDQPVNLSPVLWDDGPTGELISLWTLGNWEMTLEPACSANKIWKSRWWVEVTCPLSLLCSQMPGLPFRPIMSPAHIQNRQLKERLWRLRAELSTPLRFINSPSPYTSLYLFTCSLLYTVGCSLEHGFKPSADQPTGTFSIDATMSYLLKENAGL